MRRFFVRASLVTGLLIILGGLFLLYLSQTRPIRPGTIIFPVQYFAERQRSALMKDLTDRAYYELDLLERRIDDLTVRTGTKYEAKAVYYLDLALDNTSIAVANAIAADPESETELRARLLAYVQELQEAVLALQFLPDEDVGLYQAIHAKLDTLEIMLGASTADLTTLNDVAVIDKEPSSLSEPLLPTGGNGFDSNIPFPVGSTAAQHTFYPLLGQHATIECSSCHPSGQ